MMEFQHQYITKLYKKNGPNDKNDNRRDCKNKEILKENISTFMFVTSK